MPKVVLEAEVLRAFCSPAQVRSVAAQLTVEKTVEAPRHRPDGQPSAISELAMASGCALGANHYAVAAQGMVDFSEATHVLLAMALPCEVSDMRTGVAAIRKHLLQFVDKSAQRDAAMQHLKALDRLHVAHCELKHYSATRMMNLAKSTESLIAALDKGSLCQHERWW